ncbi:hypothetical protein N7492_005908 [Penicillium capsulatum]|uniref:Uncharacterized protein n=1 Tax=Penicillium capsulatum TaxID=69766 RepID=A0A9W9ID61_9EURO|nr:hypothetical protein N7492_005908 [Penicillium capsulatum]KAJ6134990.1 hypothetical protein N7512_000150 [Penicillium capsulatum]
MLFQIVEMALAIKSSVEAHIASKFDLSHYKLSTDTGLKIASDILFILRLVAFTLIGIPTPELIYWLRGQVPVIIPTLAGMQEHMKHVQERIYALEIRMDQVDVRVVKVVERMDRWERVAESMTKVRLVEIGTKYPAEKLGSLRYEQHAIAYERIAIGAEWDAIGAEIIAIEGDMEAIRGL